MKQDSEDDDDEHDPVPIGYAKAIELATHQELKKCVRTFYNFIDHGEAPDEEEDEEDNEKQGKAYYDLWHYLQIRHNCVTDHLHWTYSDQYPDYEGVAKLRRTLAEYEEEIAQLKKAAFSLNPNQVYQDFLAQFSEMSGIEKAKRYKVSFNKNNEGPVRYFEIYFGNRPDGRAETSVENGKHGGRPRDENPSQNAINLRNSRARRQEDILAQQLCYAQKPQPNNSPLNQRGGIDVVDDGVC